MKRLTALLVGAAMMVAFSGYGHAFSLQASTDGTTWTTVIDNHLGDSYFFTPGLISTSFNLNGFDVVVATGSTKPMLGNADHAIMTLNSVEVTSPAGGTLYLQLSDIGYMLSAPAIHVTTGLTLLDGNANVKADVYSGTSLFDHSNLIATGSIDALGADSWTNDLTSNPITGTFSLTELLTIQQFGTFSQVTSSVDVSPVPEPGTMVLLGTGLLGLGIYSRRRMKK